MGTSTSSSGPGSNISFDPPWLDHVDKNSNDAAGSNGNQNIPPAEGIAPPRRWAKARRELGDYAKTGGGDSFGRAVGHYSKSGMGGAKNAASRMRVPLRAAAGLVSLLQAARDGTNPQVN